MAKFPVEYNDQDSNAVVDAVNYVLSGPSGLGQNFSGFSNYNTVYLTGNYRLPFTTFSVSVNSLGGSGTTTITVDNITGININDYVTGPGIATGARVNAIDPLTNIVTLTAANTSSVSGTITFSPVAGAALYVAPIAVSTIQRLAPNLVQVNFTSPQSPLPFQPGNNPTVAGNSLSQYNTQYIGEGVVECTSNYVILRTFSPIGPFVPGTGTGGTITFTNTLEPPAGSALPPANIQGLFNNWVQTDCVGNATITGATDRAFISAQVDQSISYTATATSDLRITVAINRYTTRNIGSVANPQLRYSFDATVAERVYLRTGIPGPKSGTVTGTVAPDTVTLNSNAGLVALEAITISGTGGGGLSPGTYYIVNPSAGPNQITIATSLANAQNGIAITSFTTASLSGTTFSTSGTGTLTNIESIFSTFIDTPDPGGYQYRLEVLFRVVNSGGALQVTQDKIDVRTLSCQVVKQ